MADAKNGNTGRGHWSSRTGFILAAAGSAVGLGNIWKFPYITGENGGGLFVLIYIACIALVGLPILVAEILIGRAAQAQPVEAFKRLQGGPTGWSMVGWLGVVSGFLILSFYIVVAGWAMDYTLKSVVGFTNPIGERAETASLTYRTTAPIHTMRATVAEHFAAEELEDARLDWRRQFAPSTWSDWSTLTATIKAGGERDLVLEDPSLAEAAAAVEPRMGDLETRLSAIRTEVAATVGQMDDAEVREEASTIFRRDHIRNDVTDVFGGLLEDGWTSTFWAAIFMFLTIVIVARGIGSGIERSCRVLMPLLMLFIIALVVYGMFQPGFGKALSFVFKPDATELHASGVLEALGHAFFTLSLGMGAMITYGSYQRSGTGGMMGQAVSIAVFDTVIALLACMMMFPIIFSYDQNPSAGPGLVFMSMPLAFAEMGELGMLLGIMFFGLLVFAALTSAISLLEVVVSYFIDGQRWSRARATWTLGLVIFAFGVITAFANSAGFAMTSWLPGYGQSFFDTMDVLTSNWMLPLGGLLVAIYAGWILPARLRKAELSDLSGPLASTWLFLVRFVAPLLVVVVLLDKIGLINVDEIFFRMLH